MSTEFELEQDRVIGTPAHSQGKQAESRYTHQAVLSNQIYGIPQTQYQHVYGYDKEESPNKLSASYQKLDYGDKLVANHKMLKELLEIVDRKIQNRHNNSQSIVRSKINRSQIKQRQKQSENMEFKSNRLEQKMMIVKEKLKDIIGFINSQMNLKDNSKKQQQVIKSILEWQPSLVYSKDPSDIRASQSINGKSIYIDKNKLDNAKQVISRQYLQSNGHSKAEDIAFNNDAYMKSSLERISEVQSGEQIEREDYYQSEPTEPRRRPSRNQTAKNSIKYEDYSPELDETGKMIMSTINKKTVSTTTIRQNQRSQASNINIQNQSTLRQHNQQNPKQEEKKKVPLNNGIRAIPTVMSQQSLQEVNQHRFTFSNNGQISPKNKIPEVNSDMYIAVASSLGKHILQRNQSMPQIKQSTIIQHFPNNHMPHTIQKSASQQIRQHPQRQNPQLLLRQVPHPPLYQNHQQNGASQYAPRPHSIRINRSPLPSNRQPSPSTSQAQRSVITYNPQPRPSSASHSGIPYQPKMEQPVYRPITPQGPIVNMKKTAIINRDIHFGEARRNTQGTPRIHQMPATRPIIVRSNSINSERSKIFVPPSTPSRSYNPQSRILVEQQAPRQLEYSRAQSRGGQRNRSFMKKQLSQIMETSEYSAENSAKKTANNQSQSFSKFSPRVSNKNHFVSKQSHHKLKKRGIHVTNQSFSNKRIPQ